MRTIGLILVLLGALMLGYQGFASAEREPFKLAAEDKGQNVAIPPVLGGIAVTGGLILFVSGLKRL